MTGEQTKIVFEEKADAVYTMAWSADAPPGETEAERAARLVAMWKAEYGSWDDPAVRALVYAQSAERQKLHAEVLDAYQEWAASRAKE